jgi:Holliday junction resolvase RusA-like endonuclease
LPKVIILPGSIRSKKNSKRPIKVGKPGKKRFLLVPSKAYDRWEKAARKAVKSQYPPMFFMGETLHVEAHIYFKGRRPDLSGAFESIGDCLEGVVWGDDAQIESWDGSRLHHNKDNPRTEVKVSVIDVRVQRPLFE